MQKKFRNFLTEKFTKINAETGSETEGRKVQRRVKDRLFRFLFDKDRDALLQLYNALNGTDYTDTSKLQVVTIESAVYVVMKNDLAFVVAGVLNLYEHQSTYNPNMPVRFLIYLAQEYQKILEEAEESLYGTKQITLPTPQCIVFYNGQKEMPEERILRLSEAFESKELEADVELKVRMLNINYGHNTELMNKCKLLGEYAEFVQISREYAADGGNMDSTLNKAIDYCIENGILAEFLKKYRAEVIGMLLEEFDVEKYERTLKREGYDTGYNTGYGTGYDAGSAKERIKSVEELMRKLQLKLPQACELLDISEEEYWKAKDKIGNP